MGESRLQSTALVSVSCGNQLTCLWKEGESEGGERKKNNGNGDDCRDVGMVIVFVMMAIFMIMMGMMMVNIMLMMIMKIDKF